MFLHLGSNYMVRKDEIIAILNLSSINHSQVSKDFINNKIKNGKVNKVKEEGKEKTFVLSDSKCYLSPISTTTLLKRSLNNTDFSSL